MGSTHYNIGRVRTAELRRGLVFEERFKSEAQVEENGGAITGDVVSDGKFVSDESTGRIDYHASGTFKAHTFMLDLDLQTKTGDTEVVFDSFSSLTGVSFQLQSASGNNSYVLLRMGSGSSDNNGYVSLDYNSLQHIAWVYDGAGATNADRLKLYVNGQVQTLIFTNTIPTNFTFPVDLSVGNRGDGARPLSSGSILENVKLFSKALTAEEVLAYHENTMWRYDDHCELALPMLLRDHKPDVVETDAALVDGDMEAADTSAWTAGGGGALSKVSSSISGSTLALRIAGAGGYVTQALSVGSKSIRVNGYARGDGVSAPQVRTPGGAAPVWTGTTSTDWQTVSVVLTPTINFSPLFWCNGGSWVEFDEMTITELQSQTRDHSGEGRSCNLGTSPATAPTFNDGYYQLDVFKHMSVTTSMPLTSFTLNYMMKLDTPIASQTDSAPRLFHATAGSNDAIDLFFLKSNGRLYIYLKNSGGTAFVAVNSTVIGPLLDDLKQHMLSIVFDRDNNYIYIYLDAVLVDSIVAAAGTIDQGIDYVNAVCRVNDGIDGKFWYAYISSSALNPTQLQDLYQRMVLNYERGRAGI